MKKFRLIQLITGVHYIHHFYYSYGFKLPFIQVAYFKNFGFKRIYSFKLRDKNGNNIKESYHDCTLSGVY